MTKQPGLAIYVDLVLTIHKEKNPILIVELIEQEFGVYTTIHQVSDYLDISRGEDYEIESQRHFYNF